MIYISNIFKNSQFKSANGKVRGQKLKRSLDMKTHIQGEVVYMSILTENETNFSKLDQTISFEIFDRVFPLLVSQCYDDQNNNKNKRTHDKTLTN